MAALVGALRSPDASRGSTDSITRQAPPVRGHCRQPARRAARAGRGADIARRSAFACGGRHGPEAGVGGAQVALCVAVEPAQRTSLDHQPVRRLGRLERTVRIACAMLAVLGDADPAMNGRTSAADHGLVRRLDGALAFPEHGKAAPGRATPGRDRTRQPIPTLRGLGPVERAPPRDTRAPRADGPADGRRERARRGRLDEREGGPLDRPSVPRAQRAGVPSTPRPGGCAPSPRGAVRPHRVAAS